jgi:endonuclease YncB( thermonuclease family)
MTEYNINTEYEKFKNIIDHKDIPYFTFKNKIFYAKPCNIYDGDTFSIIFDFRGEIMKYRCRCMGYDSAEMKPKKSDPNRDYEKELAHKAKERFIELLTKHETGMIKVECLDFDKYGRILVNVWNCVNDDGKSINDIMIEEGYGKPYEGGHKEEW